MAEDSKESGHSTNSGVSQALSRSIHIGIPIASFFVLLAFAIVLFQPANRATLPPQSTFLFIPIYLTIVVVLVFGSMYLFKRVLDTEPGTYTGTPSS